MKTRVFPSVSGVIRHEYFSTSTSDERRDFLADNWDAKDVREVMKIDNSGISRDGIPWYAFWLSNGEYAMYYDRNRL